eukprot:TRINITY_DN2401_c0_g1_i6.p1 TRINITY_DN2401_c0_g1~~TRINITY_DN2401_c0_g1_i6.p1  ORF type:complete len:495 (-),score=68.98 TRINITY_DN2401_c0_g1_i6:106-1590(-)
MLFIQELCFFSTFVSVDGLATVAKIPDVAVRTLETDEVFETNGMVLHKVNFSSTGGGAYLSPLANHIEQDGVRGLNMVPSLLTSNLTHSNLGGQGPDSGTEDIRFSNFSVVNGRHVDLIVTEDYGTYRAHDNLRNGLKFRQGLPTSFGRINLACGSRSLLRFTLVDADTKADAEPVAFFFSASYLGDARRNKREEVCFANPRPTSFWLTEETELEVSDTWNGFWMVPTSGVVDGTIDQQQDRSITAYYSRTSEFSVEIGSEKDDGCERSEGRDFMFTFFPPTAAPIDKTKADKVVTCQTLNLMDSVVSRNELGKEETLVYSKVAFYDGEDIDLVVERISGNNLPSNPERDALKEGFGRINGQCGTAVKLRFRLVGHYDGSPVVVPNVCLSFADIDGGIDGKCTEAVTIDGFDSFYLADKTELLVTTSDGATTFSATTRGQGSDNPADPSAMSDLQSRRAVGFSFPWASEIVATLTWGPDGYGGRNIFFSGGTIA